MPHANESLAPRNSALGTDRKGAPVTGRVLTGAQPDAPTAPVTTPAPNAPTPNAPASGAASTAWASSVDALADRFGCLSDGSASGSWLVRFAGYGCAAIGASGDTTLVALRPAVASSMNDTHAGLVLGPSVSSAGSSIGVRTQLFTSHQLRTGSAPNAWEVGWVVWHYTDDDHFYYFIPKPNGWELGKRDPAYRGGQRFLATGSAPQFPVGQWHDVTIVQTGATITVRVNGRELVTFTDRETAYTRGKFGIYSEDAAVVARAVAE